MCEEIFLPENEKKKTDIPPLDAINYREEKRAIMTKTKCPRESFFAHRAWRRGAHAMQDPEMQVHNTAINSKVNGHEYQ